MDNEVVVQIPRYDSLTGLPNRALFNEVFNKALSYAKRHNKILAILIVELNIQQDETKVMNKRLKDPVLKDIGNRFTQVLRSEDFIAKLEGDEFIVLLNDIDKPKFASAVAEKLLKVCSEIIQIDHLSFTVTISMGISIYPNDGDTLNELLNTAEAALYKAKSAGEGIYQFHTQEMNGEAQVFIEMSKDLRQGLTQNELVLYYQPKLNVKQGKITGVEALIRWKHPRLGMLTPEKFLSVAEETGLIIKIGEWILRQACQINKFWQDEGYDHLMIAVNLSSKQFYHPKIAETIATILKETQLNPAYLEIEISESSVMGNIEEAASILDTIKATGVRIALDHFGVGHTSISYLKKFPLNAVKIDPSYIKGASYIPSDTAITNAFISLAHHLGLEVVAEGVETAEQVTYLMAQECDLIQGYFLSHPVPAEKIVVHFNKLAESVLI